MKTAEEIKDRIVFLKHQTEEFLDEARLREWVAEEHAAKAAVSMCTALLKFIDNIEGIDSSVNNNYTNKDLTNNEEKI